MDSGFSRGDKIVIGFIVFALMVIIGGVITINSPFFGYYNHGVSSSEVGVETVRGVFVRVLPPGRHTNMSKFADVTDVNVSAIQFSATDPEVLTSDQQRIGLVVSGTVNRPGLAGDNQLTEENWRQYQALYTSDDMLIARVSGLSQQAMKVCVGSRTFEEAAIGATRNDLRICIQDEIRKLSEPYFLTIDNVIVPNIIISIPVQEQLDQITASLNDALLARANSELASANAETDLAEAQGEIRVQQGIVQEQERQQALTADLERQRLEAEQAVINAQSANDITRAEYEVRIAELELEKERLLAESSLAREVARAELFEANPAYAEYLIIKEQAVAVQGIDFAYVPVGTSLFFPFDSVTPMADVGNGN